MQIIEFKKVFIPVVLSENVTPDPFLGAEYAITANKRIEKAMAQILNNGRV